MTTANPNPRTNPESATESHVQSARVTANAVEALHPTLGAHLKRVAMLAKNIAVKMSLPKVDVLNLEIAGLLHDLGKLSLPPHMRDVPFSKLDESMIAVVHRHPAYAQTLLSFCHAYDEAGIIIRDHLERLDGTGYPDGLTAENIPTGSRILGVANAYDELMQNRVFSLEVFPTDKLKEEFAFSHLKKMSGKQFDKDVVEVLENEIIGALHQNRTEPTTVERLAPGMIIASNISTKDGELLISGGVMLNPIQVTRIKAYYDMGLLNRNVSVSVQKTVRFQ